MGTGTRRGGEPRGLLDTLELKAGRESDPPRFSSRASWFHVIGNRLTNATRGAREEPREQDPESGSPSQPQRAGTSSPSALAEVSPGSRFGSLQRSGSPLCFRPG